MSTTTQPHCSLVTVNGDNEVWERTDEEEGGKDNKMKYLYLIPTSVIDVYTITPATTTTDVPKNGNIGKLRERNRKHPVSYYFCSQDRSNGSKDEFSHVSSGREKTRPIS